MNDLILADRELEVGFIGKLDALFEGIERMDAGHKASPSNEQFLTDKEVSAWRTTAIMGWCPTTSWVEKSCTRSLTSKIC